MYCDLHLKQEPCEQCYNEEAGFIKKLMAENKESRGQAIRFADWLDSLRPSERTSLWSKDGSGKGLFTMDNEQLFNKFKRWESGTYIDKDKAPNKTS
jgi:hypothetical protein